MHKNVNEGQSPLEEMTIQTPLQIYQKWLLNHTAFVYKNLNTYTRLIHINYRACFRREQSNKKQIWQHAFSPVESIFSDLTYNLTDLRF
ncbi:CLUMA_CG015450, isoform A [Clunio marinus]|uniref:CLUMA_CG015450, isoform A n=1 Tax=Clunio marinus TaxID=568069 RepID=A0A1J1IQL3_9DIPT|nr:CLUMA_CG015450, isoform A [Clunio marinus]